jgi:hypothetical protein
VSAASNLRRLAVLWFVATALALTAALIGWSKNGEIEWALYAGAVFTAVMGWSALRRSKSIGD